MSDIAAPAAPAPAPSAPASAPSAPASTPSADPRGAPPKGHKWAAPAPTRQAEAPAGKLPVPVPAAARTPQQVSTGEPPKAAAKAQQPAPTKPDPNAKPETQAQREARIIKHKLASGEEIDIDIAEHLERALATEKRKVKVNGQEREVTVAEALNNYQLREAAHQRFREATEATQRAKQMEEQLARGLQPLRDPKQALSVLTRLHGPETAQRIMEEHLAAIYERERMPAEQRKALEEHEARTRDVETREQKLQRERQEFEAARQAEAKQRFEAERTSELTRLQRDVPILLKEVGLPITPRMMARWAQAAHEARSLKIPYTERQIAERVAEEYREEMAHFGEAADPETLRRTLGKGADKLREAEVSRVMSQPGRGRAQVAKPGKPPAEIRTPEQFKKWLHQQDLAAERRGR